MVPQPGSGLPADRLLIKVINYEVIRYVLLNISSPPVELSDLMQLLRMIFLSIKKTISFRFLLLKAIRTSRDQEIVAITC
jgi:hypothetical protein